MWEDFYIDFNKWIAEKVNTLKISVLSTKVNTLGKYLMGIYWIVFTWALVATRYTVAVGAK